MLIMRLHGGFLHVVGFAGLPGLVDLLVVAVEQGFGHGGAVGMFWSRRVMGGCGEGGECLVGHEPERVEVAHSRENAGDGPGPARKTFFKAAMSGGCCRGVAPG